MRAQKKRFCMNCGMRMPLEAKRCPVCGTGVVIGEPMVICKNCGARILYIAKFCSECGTRQPT